MDIEFTVRDLLGCGEPPAAGIARPTHRARREACQGWEARTATEGMRSGAMMTTDRDEHSMVTGQRAEVTGGVARRRYRAVRSNTGWTVVRLRFLGGHRVDSPGSTGYCTAERVMCCIVQQRASHLVLRRRGPAASRQPPGAGFA